MLKKLKQLNKGFTIIEVLIVLAIAGLILLIVFLAVPALQRNQRNSARRGDASRIAAASISFVANNNGAPIGGTTYTTGQAQTDAGVILSDVGTLGQYSLAVAAGGAASGKLTITNGVTAAIGPAILDAVNISTAAVCGTAGATTTTGATSRSIAIQYTIETGVSTVSSPACQNAQ